jgi:hypothetical protein
MRPFLRRPTLVIGMFTHPFDRELIASLLAAVQPLVKVEAERVQRLEDDCCEAAVAFLEKTTGRSFCLDERPDRTQPKIGFQGKAVERIYADDTGFVCMEHTRVLTYEDEVLFEVFLKFVRAVDVVLNVAAPYVPNLPDLNVWLDVFAFRKRKPADVQLPLIEWILNNLPPPLQNPGKPPCTSGVPEGLSTEVLLCRREFGDRRILFGRKQIPDIAASCSACTEQAFTAKIPKLDATRRAKAREKPSESVLVREVRGINHPGIAPTYANVRLLLPRFPLDQHPDWILIVESDRGQVHHLGVARAPSGFAHLVGDIEALYGRGRVAADRHGRDG